MWKAGVGKGSFVLTRVQTTPLTPPRFPDAVTDAHQSGTHQSEPHAHCGTDFNFIQTVIQLYTSVWLILQKQHCLLLTD